MVYKVLTYNEVNDKSYYPLRSGITESGQKERGGKYVIGEYSEAKLNYRCGRKARESWGSAREWLGRKKREEGEEKIEDSGRDGGREGGRETSQRDT